MSKPTIITFTGPWRGYSAGEVAGFDDDVAQKLIEAGKAEPYTGKKAKKASPAPTATDGKSPSVPEAGSNTNDDAGGGTSASDEDSGVDDGKP